MARGGRRIKQLLVFRGGGVKEGGLLNNYLRLSFCLHMKQKGGEGGGWGLSNYIRKYHKLKNKYFTVSLNIDMN